MIHYRMLSFFLMLMAVTLSATACLAQPSSLDITISNIEKNSGKIVVEIYQDKSSWLKSPFRTLTLSTDADTKTASFTVDHGKYAISVYQDINGNGELDRNFIGIPKEPVGFGNNYKPFGKPGYESAVIEHKPAFKPDAIKLFSAF